MDITQQNGMSLITIDTPLTQSTVGELNALIAPLGMSEPHKIVLDMRQMPYLSADALLQIFQHYERLFLNGFPLEIQGANPDVVSTLTLANFNLLADIKRENYSS